MTTHGYQPQSINIFEHFAPILVQAGYSPIPIEVASKRPLSEAGDWSRFRNSTLTPSQIATIAERHPNAGIGVVGGFNGLVPIDIDTDDPEIVAAMNSVLPEALVGKRGQKGFTGFFRCIEPIPARKFRSIRGVNLFEILTTGQTVLPPTRHPRTGRPYEWINEIRSLLNVPVMELSIITPKHIMALEDVLSRWIGPPSNDILIRPAAVKSRREWQRHAHTALAAVAEKLRTAKEGSRNRRLFEATCTIGRFVHHGLITQNDVERSFLEACAANGLLNDDGQSACLATIASGLRISANDTLSVENAALEKNGSVVTSPDTVERRGAFAKVDMLVGFARAPNVELFHSPDGTAFADIIVDDHRETWAINSGGFDRWLRHALYRETGGAASKDQISTALSTIATMAIFDGKEREVYLRVAEQDTRIFLDLCDDRWAAIEINQNGWNIVDRPDVRFRRTKGMVKIPDPVQGGCIDALRDVVNLDDNSFVLAVSWLLAVLRGRGPYPILALSGEQGTGKSLTAKLLRSLIDPHEPAHASLPRDVRDLYIGAMNRHILAFDNLSSISTEISDSLCRLSTGGGFATRALFTDGDETIFNGQRPIILTSIGDVANRSDLADRLLMVRLEVIPEIERRTEAACLSAFEATRPKILGALLDIVTHGLRQLPETRLAKLPRMADYAMWATACETAIWTEGTFLGAYDANRNDAGEMVLESDPLAMTLIQMIPVDGELVFTPTQLLEALNTAAPEHLRIARQFPNHPRALSARLTRLNPAFRGIGIFIDAFKESGTGARRLIRIQRKRVG